MRACDTHKLRIYPEVCYATVWSRILTTVATNLFFIHLPIKIKIMQTVCYHSIFCYVCTYIFVCMYACACHCHPKFHHHLNVSCISLQTVHKFEIIIITNFLSGHPCMTTLQCCCMGKLNCASKCLIS